MKRLGPLLVAAGLVVAFMVGQARRAMGSEHAAVAHVLGVLLDIVATVAAGGLLELGWYLHAGSWVPMQRRGRVFVEERHREVLAMATDPNPRKEAEGVWSYPPWTGPEEE